MNNQSNPTAQERDGGSYKGALVESLSRYPVPTHQLLRLFLLHAENALARFSIEAIRSLLEVSVEAGILSAEERIHIVGQIVEWRIESGLVEIDAEMQAIQSREDSLISRHEALRDILGENDTDYVTFSARRDVPQRAVNEFLKLRECWRNRWKEIENQQFLLIAPDLEHLLPSLEFVQHAKIVPRDDANLTRLRDLSFELFRRTAS